MAKPKEIGPLGSSANIRFLLAATSGWGKTVFSGTAPKALFLTTDPEGTLSARKFGSKAEEWRISDWDGVNKAYRWMRDEGCGEYEWLIVDNITEMQIFALEDAVRLSREKDKTRDEFVPALKDYQRSQIAFVQMVKRFHSLPINIIWTAHTKVREDADGDLFYSVAIDGKEGQIAEQVLGYMNIIGFGDVVTKDEKEIRRIYFTHYKMYRGKDRFVALGRARDDLTVPKMEAIIRGSARTQRTRPATTTTRKKRTSAQTQA